MNSTPLDIAHGRVRRVLEFLRRFQALKTPPVRSIEEYRWRLSLDRLPQHPGLSVGWIAETNTDEGTGTIDGLILQISRPRLTDCPSPPDAIRPWLLAGWQKFDRQPEILQTQNENVGAATRTVNFTDDSQRVLLRDEWLERRAKWIAAETPARDAESVYQRFYSLYGEIERESENVRLMLGDGMLRADDFVGRINHPVLLQRVELRFDPTIPSFSVVETDDPPELALALIGSVTDSTNQTLANTKQLAQCQIELSENPRIHPLGGRDTNGFLARLINGVFGTKGKFVDESDEPQQSGELTLQRAPAIFLAPRSGSFATAIDAAIERLVANNQFTVSKALAGLVGIDLGHDQRELLEHGLPGLVRKGGMSSEGGVRPGDMLLTRDANPEQEQVIRQVDLSGMVLVQGPPGTGKTHTIANLIGHALAHGKTVLVTSHTAKALRVLREKIVPALRPLCVSLLDTDASSREELKQAVTAIGQHLGTKTQEQLDAEVVTLAATRADLVDKLTQANEALRQAVRDEYVDIVVGGEGTNPAQAARLVAEFQSQHDWLPGPIAAGSGLPLSTPEIAELYESNRLLTEDDERELKGPLVDESRMPSPSELGVIHARIHDLRATNVDGDVAFWSSSACGNTTDIQRAIEWFESVAAALKSEPNWYHECVEAGIRGGSAINVWTELSALIEETCSLAAESRSFSLRQDIHEFPNGLSHKQLVVVCREIARHIRRGGSLGLTAQFLNWHWTPLVKWKIKGRSLTSPEDFEAVGSRAALEIHRDKLVSRWQHQLDGLKLDGAVGQDTPEEFFRQFIPRFNSALQWHQVVGAEIVMLCGKIGVRWNELLASQSQCRGSRPFVARWVAAIEQLLPLLKRRASWLERQRYEKLHRELVEHFSSVMAKSPNAVIPKQLIESATRGHVESYEIAACKLRRLKSLVEPYRRRLAQLEKIRKSAPKWANRIAGRITPHDADSPPSDVTRAWSYRQWFQELDRRADTDVDALQRKVNEFSQLLTDVTARFVVSATWAEQRRRRYSLSLRQALHGWLQTITKAGFERGVRSAQLKAQARQQLRDARPAVPVWIMPLSRVAESFDFKSERFDMVIIDEASQCDVLGILPMTIATEIVVVGDDEQVSPSAVGQNLGQIQALIDQYLFDLRNKQSFDGKMSIYDLAKGCFGDTIRLVEHFRCVPEIIQFSNSLCYEGSIKPLRDSHDVLSQPFVIEYRVVNGVARNKVNDVEANEVASLLVAASEQREYRDMTMGVISMVGGEQAELIDMRLRRRLVETQYASRRILCGSAAEFQGDERHVMFLSMVDSSPEGKPLRKDKEAKMFRQRFNVAASRAQNQLWVVHSLNPDTELQSGDLRLRLIQHARDPCALTRQLAAANLRVQSEFERLVIRRLIDRNYRIEAQWEVGAFSIDIVVFGNAGRKVAIECDGDRFHTLANLDDDYRRQLMLERLGWRFIRIRSSKFFRDSDATMTVVFDRLLQLGVDPIGPRSDGLQDVLEDTELKTRIIRRAEELRKEWEQEEQETTEGTEEKKFRWRRNWSRSAGRSSDEAHNKSAAGQVPPLTEQQGPPLPESQSPPAPRQFGDATHELPPVATGQNCDIHVPVPVAKGGQEPDQWEAWRMTLTQWKQRCEQLMQSGDEEGLKLIGGVNINLGFGAHRVRVETALKEGQQIPPEVLSDYPDLLDT